VCQSWRYVGPGLTHVRISHSNKVGRIASVLFLSDAHFDSRYCHRALLKKHLDAAKSINAAIVSIGDFYDAMQGRDDPRRRASELRPEYLTDDYLGQIARDGVQFLEPYPIAAMSDGNHEDAITHRRGVNLTRMTVDALNQTRNDDQKVLMIDYSGFIVFQLTRSNGSSWRYVVWYHHGYGGGGPVTKGLIQYARQTPHYVADAYLMGHVHESTFHQTTRCQVSQDYSKIVEKPIVHVRGGGYKAEHWSPSSWASQKGMQPKPRTSWLLQFIVAKDTIRPAWCQWDAYAMPGADKW